MSREEIQKKEQEKKQTRTVLFRILDSFIDYWTGTPTTNIFAILGLAIVLAVFNYFQIYFASSAMTAGWLAGGGSVSPLPIFYMVPFAFSTYVCFGIALICGLLFLLVKKDLRFDLVLVSSAQVGVVLGAITIIIGMMWAKVEWGAFWDWNDRETITLIMWLVYVALLIFRDMLDEDDHEKKATISAVFGVVAFLSVPLSYVIVGVLHPIPSQTSYSTGAGTNLMFNFLFVGIFAVILIYQNYKINTINFNLRKIRKIKMEEL
ncbi:MAG: cytochrome c biogenesis protein CcsA [Candidatus Hodarchaeales archaeon]